MERKTFEELEQLKQERCIGWVDFLQQSEYSESYQQGSMIVAQSQTRIMLNYSWSRPMLPSSKVRT